MMVMLYTTYLAFVVCQKQNALALISSCRAGLQFNWNESSKPNARIIQCECV